MSWGQRDNHRLVAGASLDDGGPVLAVEQSGDRVSEAVVGVAPRLEESGEAMAISTTVLKAKNE